MCLWATDHPVLSHFLSCPVLFYRGLHNLQERNVCSWDTWTATPAWWLRKYNLICVIGVTSRNRPRRFGIIGFQRWKEGLTRHLYNLSPSVETLETWRGWSDLVKITELRSDRPRTGLDPKHWSLRPALSPSLVPPCLGSHPTGPAKVCSWLI